MTQPLRLQLGAFGDPGHAFPMLALGRALRARGHDVTLETWRRWREYTEAEGVRFAPNTAGIALRVPDVEAAREHLRAHGVEFLGETLDTGVCSMGFFYDPDGNVLILHRRYAAL